MTDNSTVKSPTPALAAARRALVATGARSIVPIGGVLPEDVSDCVLLSSGVPSAALLGELAAALRSAKAVVVWAPGWDQATALAALDEHHLCYGSVDIVERGEAGVLAVLVRDAAAARALVVAGQQQRTPFRALAIMPAFNEADIIYHAIGALVAGGVDVYLIDHESTDGTAEAAAPWLGRGLIAIERFPEDAGYAERNRGEMVWRDILRRVQEVSGEIEADWYLFVNADEFREAPWPATTLLDGLREVDETGYSAVNFELFNFRPIDDGYQPGTDPRAQLRHYEPPGRHDLLQVKAWKRQPQVVDLVHHGGHDVLFEGKRVYPIPFLLRHYPIRSSAHGARKVLAERLPRFAAEERAGGWHVQYDHYADGSDYLHDPAELTEWNGEHVRSTLLAASARRLVLASSLAGFDAASAELDMARLASWVARRRGGTQRAIDLPQANQRLVEAVASATQQPSPLDAVAADLGLLLEAQARLRGDMVLASTLADAQARLAGAGTPGDCSQARAAEPLAALAPAA